MLLYEHMNDCSYNVKGMNIVNRGINLKCSTCKVHRECVDEIMKDMPTDERVCDLSDLFKVFGDTTRIKILYSIFKKEMCVCDIAEAIDMTQSAVSHQLKILKQARLIKPRKEGKEVFYSLDDEHIQSIFKEGLEHIKERG